MSATTKSAQDSNIQEYLISFDHYTRTTNAGGINTMHPNWVSVRMSMISRIEECPFLNDEMFKNKMQVNRRIIEANGKIDDGPWFGWRKVIKSFYEVTLENNVSYVVSNKTRDEIIHLMEKAGINQYAIFDCDEND